jgi:hypothetical protein
MKFTKREVMQSNGSGGNTFLKLKDGESKAGVFRGEIYEFLKKWENGKSQVVGPDDPEGKTSFRLNFVTLEDGKFTAKTWEFGITVYNQLADIHEEYDLSKTKVKITRRGTGTDTTYMVLPLLKEPIPAKTMKEIEAVILNMLEHPQAVKKEVKNYAPGSDGEELPF